MKRTLIRETINKKGETITLMGSVFIFELPTIA